MLGMAISFPFVGPEFKYMILPWVHKAPVFGKIMSYASSSWVESAFRTRQVPAEVLRLVDGRMVYRVSLPYMYKFKSDAKGPYLQMIGGKKLYFSDLDPNIEARAVNGKKGWLPI